VVFHGYLLATGEGSRLNWRPDLSSRGDRRKLISQVTKDFFTLCTLITRIKKKKNYDSLKVAKCLVI
jgi:hypothetical protein